MNTIREVVHRGNVRLVRALKRFRDAFERGQVLVARQQFETIRTGTMRSLAWEERIIHRSVQGSGSIEDLRLLVRDQHDHGRIEAILDEVHALVRRSVDGEMGLDQPVLDLLDDLTKRLEAHATGIEEPLCSLLDRELPAGVAEDVALGAARAAPVPFPPAA